jgi:hypothetical protein
MAIRQVILYFICYYSIGGAREEGDKGAAVDILK